uniref:26S proteasome regulatory subunit 10B n=17 Tax=Aves TaxID=8782 RepID=A0A8C0U015_CYACU
MTDHPFREEISPDTRFKLTLAQLVAVSPCPVPVPWEQSLPGCPLLPGTCAEPQGPPEPPFLQAEPLPSFPRNSPATSQLPKQHLILQTLPQLCSLLHISSRVLTGPPVSFYLQLCCWKRLWSRALVGLKDNKIPCFFPLLVREQLKELTKQYEKSENDLKALQSVGQIVGEVLKQLTEEKFIVKATNGPRYVVGCRRQLDKSKLKPGTRVALDMTTLTIMRYLPREVDPLVYNMSHEDPGDVSYSEIGGLSEQIRELREVIELPLTNPELFQRVGIIPPKGCLLYGPPGTGKTLLARAVASQLDCNFLKVVSSSIVDKYIGESARLIREMFNYARDHQPCIIFMDEIDAIGGRRFSEGTSADREIQRTLMELLNQMDGFDTLHRVKMIMATNRPDTLDPALLRPGRLDRKIHIDLPNEQARLDILKIHAGPITKHGEIDYEAIVKLSDGFNGADLRNVCTEAGMFAIRADHDFVVQEDFMKAVRKVADSKKLESKLDYKPV